MTLLWALLGVFVGVATIPPNGLVSLVAGLLAGSFVLTPLGTILGLLGGRPKPTLIGALAGSTLGVLAAAFSPASSSSLFSLGLIAGGLAGATGAVFFGFAFSFLRAFSPAGRKL
jgi:hypothetical protein